MATQDNPKASAPEDADEEQVAQAEEVKEKAGDTSDQVQGDEISAQDLCCEIKICLEIRENFTDWEERVQRVKKELTELGDLCQYLVASTYGEVAIPRSLIMRPLFMQLISVRETIITLNQDIQARMAMTEQFKVIGKPNIGPSELAKLRSDKMYQTLSETTREVLESEIQHGTLWEELKRLESSSNVMQKYAERILEGIEK